MKAATHTTFSALLLHDDRSPEARDEWRRQLGRMLVPIAAVAVALGTWSVLAPLSGAGATTARVKVELNRKTIQHQEGGIVREILVRDGQKVRAGDPLIVVGNVRSEAELNLLQDQFARERIRSARAAAEAALERSFVAPPGVDANPGVAAHLARERALFAARRRTLDDQIAALTSQIADARAQAEALGAQIAATESSAKLSAEELAINDKLAQEGFIQRTRLIALQRTEADYRGRVGEYRSELALARQRAGELEARIAQVRNHYQQAADEFRESSARVGELEERLRPSQDQVERQYVRSPVDGEVMALRVSAVGEVLAPRQPILDVVPAAERLVVEARIRPEDVDHVRKDAAAEVRLTSGDGRNAPLLPGKVVFVTPDRISEPNGGEGWFVATVEVDAAPLGDRADLNLQPGMPAEVYVATRPRTLLEYLADPLRTFSRRAMREP
jgi:HlyD family type I secretion membrane fusion protein